MFAETARRRPIIWNLAPQKLCLQLTKSSFFLRPFKVSLKERPASRIGEVLNALGQKAAVQMTKSIFLSVLGDRGSQLPECGPTHSPWDGMLCNAWSHPWNGLILGLDVQKSQAAIIMQAPVNPIKISRGSRLLIWSMHRKGWKKAIMKLLLVRLHGGPTTWQRRES